MDLYKDWSLIRSIVHKSLRSQLHVAVATVNTDNSPDITPIGSLILLSNQRGIFFEQFASSIPKNSRGNTAISILAVNSSKLFWFKSLLFGKFSQHPGIRLHGIIGKKREATAKELSIWQKRIRAFKSFRGYNIIWKDMKMVREIEFTDVSALNLGNMTNHL